MKRISTSTRVVNKFGAGKDGFTDGSVVGGVPATDLEASFFDHMQEEIAAVIEDLGVALDPNNRAQLLAALKGRLLGVRVFSTVGSFIYNPTQGVKAVLVEVQAGGGGAAGTEATASNECSVAAGGNSGSYGRSFFTAGFAGVTVVVGAGGAAGPAGAGSGGTGGTSSFGALLSASGGAGSISTRSLLANLSIATPQGVVTTVTGANIFSSRGSVGGQGITLNAGQVGGFGGASQFGGGGAGGGSNRAGFPALNPGSGGGGGGNGVSLPAQAGTPGGPGIVIVHEFA